MSITITRAGKHSLTLTNPIMNAAGVLGFGDAYRDLIDLTLFGAFVTNPVTYSAWNPAGGGRVARLDAGVLLHTGLPNPGIRKTITNNRAWWERLNIPIIVHLVINDADDVRRCMRLLDEEDSVTAIELGLSDDISPAETEWYLRAVLRDSEKAAIVRIPYSTSLDHARAAAAAGADALVVSAAPRGTGRGLNGRLMTGRVYSPTVKPLALRMVGQAARQLGVPIIGAGGVHSADDARDFLEAGALAVQVDSAIWVEPSIIERITRELAEMPPEPGAPAPDDADERQ